jgi:pimeloyl-ACP methyl ester carboxylesterase
MEFISGDERLFYRVEGEGHPLIILHAMGTDHRSMSAWIEPVFDHIDGVQRIYIDIPAHGKSNIVNRLKSTQDMLDLILAFIDSKLSSRTFSLLGHSFGGYLAQGIMSQKLGSIKGICLLAPALHLKERILPQKVVRDRDIQQIDALDPDIKQAIETLMVYQNKENIESFLKEIQPGRLLANREFLQSNWREKGYFLKNKPFSDTTHILQPSLIILGKQDAICGYEDHIPFINMFTNLTFSILNNAGHLIPIEKRESVQVLVRDWISTIIE